MRGVLVSHNVKNAVERYEKFNITAACEVMAILTLAEDIDDLKRRLGNILVAYDFEGNPVYCRQLHGEEAMAILLKDALKPNLVQTLGYTPAIVHCGPFANIAHGCNSVQATKIAMTLADYTVTEAGFGADLGAEKFLDVKCRVADLKPDAVVIVATVRALKLNGGADKNSLAEENLDALRKGMPNLIRHINNIVNVYRLPCVVAINRFTTDTDAEVEMIKSSAENQGVKAVEADVWGKGGKGAIALAEEVVRLCDRQSKRDFRFAYEDSDSVEEKITKVATRIYGAGKVVFTDKAKQSLSALKKLDIDKYPVVIAKTQYLFPIRSVIARRTGKLYSDGQRCGNTQRSGLYSSIGRQHAVDARIAFTSQCGQYDDILRRCDRRALLR